MKFLLNKFEIEKEKAFAKINKIINKAAIMIFIKGNKDAPEDDDSREICEYLKTLNAKFYTFDVLSNIKIRQWIKFYTDCESFPQVFVKGKSKRFITK